MRLEKLTFFFLCNVYCYASLNVCVIYGFLCDVGLNAICTLSLNKMFYDIRKKNSKNMIIFIHFDSSADSCEQQIYSSS